MASDELFPISRVAAAFGLSVPTLRFYEERSLITATARRARVRHYDRAELIRLAYALLWHRDAGMTIDETRDIIETRRTDERHARIHDQIATIDDRIAQLQSARAVLDHLLTCPSGDPMSCPETGEKLQRTVDAALDRRL